MIPVFDPLVADVLCDPRTVWDASRGVYLRNGVIYEFSKREVERATMFFLRRLGACRPNQRRRLWGFGRKGDQDL